MKRVVRKRGQGKDFYLLRKNMNYLKPVDFASNKTLLEIEKKIHKLFK